MNCPYCDRELPASRTKALLETSIDQVTLLHCGVCGKIGVLRGSKLVQATKALLDEMSEEDRAGFLDAWVRIRAQVVGPERALEEVEQAKAMGGDDVPKS